MSFQLTLGQLADWTSGRLSKGAPETVISGISTDSRALKTDEAFLALRGLNFDGHDFIEAALSAKSPLLILESGHPTLARAIERADAVLAVQDTLYAYGEIARHYRDQFTTKRIAITGSVGKTSTRGFIASVLNERFSILESEKNYNNLIGLPRTLLQLDETHEYAVLELGADRPGEIARLTEIAGPNLGVITGIVPCHLERFGTLDGIVEEKGKLLSGLEGKNALTLIAANTYGRTHFEETCSGSVLTYGVGKGDFRAESIHLDADGFASFTAVSAFISLEVKLNVIGAHQVKNATAAFAVGCLEGLEADEIKRGLESYSGAWGRLERVELGGSITLLKDVYNANPESTKAALAMLASLGASRRIAVLGDMFELGDDSERYHREIGIEATRFGFDALLTVGERAKAISDQALESGFLGLARALASNVEAKKILDEWLREGDLVLLKASRAMKFEEIADHMQSTRPGENTTTGGGKNA